MRIIAGEKRGMVLKTPRGHDFRPTLGRVRESLFGILTPVITDAKVLDLFAGSGALGLEALSRGASDVLFVEIARGMLKIIEANVAKTGYGDRCRCYLGDFAQVGKKVAPAETFDLVFADPPYMQGYPARVIDLVLERELLVVDGLLILEMNRRELPKEPESGLRLIRANRYGATIVWILRREI
jgi:16S rRNA (guanine966-N2)-methyltransferase